ncbi:hypothetical protein WDZ92_51165 [Nostoc sp. NIES-2111]
MPRYFLDVFKGANEIHSETGIEADNRQDAASQAMRMCELLRGAVSTSGMDAKNWLLVGRDEAGNHLFAINLSTVLSAKTGETP